MIEVGITLGECSWQVYAVPVRGERWEAYFREAGSPTFWSVPDSWPSKEEAVAAVVRRLVKYGRNVTGGDGLLMTERT
jgi:hypothetical protein